MRYLYEHTWLGMYGHLLVVAAFVLSLMAFFSYAKASNHANLSRQASFWKSQGKAFFLGMSVCAVCVIALLYYIMLNHYFEFHYVWKYTNLSMNAAYMLSSFWSGQEGSLLLWAAWIIVFSFVILHKFKEWEAPVLAVVSVALMFIFSMLLGVYVGDTKIGSNPFILIRELPENAGMPWTQLPDYLRKIEGFQDGTGLNPLLQNYWMAIHPPTLFSGFAAALFPFAFALAGIFQSKKTWLQPAKSWTIAALFTLGAGILMGGAWAYEALSFGGFWAWDPVENASLVPWIVALGGLHTLIISIKRKKGYFMSALLCLLPFILVLYSSFLTRSGVLGESSVHSFTENGLMTHLMVFLFAFTVAGMGVLMRKTRLIVFYFAGCLLALIALWIFGHPGVILGFWLALTTGMLIYAYEKVYASKLPEDRWSSREFWMTMAMMVLLISAIHIIISTSVPVINRLFGTSFDAFTDLDRRNAYYGDWQVPFAIIVVALMGAAHLLSYKNTDKWGAFLRALKWPAPIALAVALAAVWLVPELTGSVFYPVLLFVAALAVATNVQWFIRMMRKNTALTGAAVSHAGFGLLIAGALISSAGKRPVSENRSGMDLQTLDETFLNKENVMLRKGDTVMMDKYFISYRGKSSEGVNLHYEISYFDKMLNDAGEWVPGDSLFTLYPYIQRNEKFGNVAEPDTRHYLTHDVFTHVKWADTQYNDYHDWDDDYMNETKHKISVGSELQHENIRVQLQDVYLLEGEREADGLEPNDIVVQAKLLVQDVSNPERSDLATPLFVVRDSSQVIRREFYSDAFQTRFAIAELSREPQTIGLAIQEKEYLVMQALIFPGMNILWAGCVLLVVGLGISLVGRRRRE